MALRLSSRRLLKLRDLSPFVKKELRFDKFPRHEGGGRTLAALVGSNVCVWAAWQTAKVKALDGDEQLLSFMGHHFVGSNQGMSELHNLHRIILPSFSHEDLAHLTGNMSALLLLGPRLHEFLGRARFLALYLAGSVGGTLATQWLHLDPAWEAKSVQEMPRRYQNILDNHNPGQAVGLGASDAISALFACFYLLFPRQPVPFLWMKSNVVWALLPQVIRTSTPGTYMTWVFRRTQAAAIWVLPMFFFVDFVEVWKRLRGHEVYESGLLPKSNTGHAAHVGGFLAGTSFYVLVAHPLKAKYFDFTRKEMLRRAYLMTLSLSFWYLITKGIKDLMGEKSPSTKTDGKKVVFMLTYGGAQEGEEAAKEADKEESAQVAPAIHRALEQVWESDPRMPQLVFEANRCSIRESCFKHPTDGRSGACDEHFDALRDYLHSVSTAPRSMATLLAPQFLDSVAVCRTVLRQFGPAEFPSLKVHDGYREMSPAINDLELTLHAGWLAYFPFLLPLVGDSVGSLRKAGMLLKEKDKEVRLVSVKRGSIADSAGARAHVGHAVTHVNNTEVSSLEDVRKAIQSGSVHFWFEERRTKKRKKPPPSSTEKPSSADAETPEVTVRQCVQVVDLRRWGWRSEAKGSGDA